MKEFFLKGSDWFLAVAAVAACIGAFVVAMHWQIAIAAINKVNATLAAAPVPSEAITAPPARVKPPRQVVKGLYLTAYSANDPAKLDEIIHLIDTTELNAVVIDIKDYSGLVLFDSKLPIVNKLHLKDNRFTDLAATIKKLHEHHIYVIARETVFEDPVLAAAKPEWAIKTKEGGIWKDQKGLSWVDPTKLAVWKYEIDIAKEAAQYDFDEINFDYVRFPSDGDMRDVAYDNGAEPKYRVMYDFYQYVHEQMANEPVWTSFDMFGLVMEEKGTSDMGIGQRLTDAVGAVDYIDPMMYPSLYAPGHLGYANPAAHPVEVIAHGLEEGLPAFASSTTEVRPWIQAFNLGAIYDGTMIREEIDTVEKYSHAGWLLWNAENRYTAAGLKSATSTYAQSL